MLGLSYYLLFRPDAGITRFVCATTGYTSPINDIVRDGLLYRLINGYFADFLWAFALTLVLNFIMILDERDVRHAFMLSLVADVLMELFQAVGVMNGTFDVWDIIVQVFSTIIAQMVVYRTLKRRKKYVSN